MKTRTLAVVAALLLTVPLAAQQPTAEQTLQAIREALAKHDAPPPPSAPPVISVAAGGDLRAALAEAPEGATVECAPSATYIGNFIVPRRLLLRGAGTLAEGRATKEQAEGFCRLHSTSNAPALLITASDVTVHGVSFSSAGAEATMVTVGDARATDPAALPQRVVLDRVGILGNETAANTQNGIELHSGEVTVRRSYIADVMLVQEESHGIQIGNATGPVLIEDNFISAGSIAVMTGGDTMRLPGVVPTGITIRNNEIHRKPEWRTKRFGGKPPIEFKMGRQIVIEGNTIEWVWTDAQEGYAISLKDEDQYGQSPWIDVSDVRIVGNIIRNAAGGIKLANGPGRYPSGGIRQVTIAGNLLVIDKDILGPAGTGGSGRALQLNGPIDDLTVEGNTFISDGSSFAYTPNTGQSARFIFRRNVAFHNTYGFSGAAATANSLTVLTTNYPGFTWEQNVIAGGTASRYPQGTLLPAADALRGSMVNFGAGLFGMRPESPYAGLGADVAALPQQ